LRSGRDSQLLVMNLPNAPRKSQRQNLYSFPLPNARE
jgi:hypothetical protein